MGTALVSPDGQTPFTSGNLVPASTLTSWMQAAIGSPTASASQWNFAMDKNVVGGFRGPEVDLGWGDSKITAEAYLAGIRSWQQASVVAPTVTAGGFAGSGGAPLPSNGAPQQKPPVDKAMPALPGQAVEILIGALVIGLALWWYKHKSA